jgi:hypothetical protein
MNRPFIQAIPTAHDFLLHVVNLAGNLQEDGDDSTVEFVPRVTRISFYRGFQGRDHSCGKIDFCYWSHELTTPTFRMIHVWCRMVPGKIQSLTVHL